MIFHDPPAAQMLGSPGGDRLGELRLQDLRPQPQFLPLAFRQMFQTGRHAPLVAPAPELGKAALRACRPVEISRQPKRSTHDQRP